MRAATRRGLAPVRKVLDNGAVVIAKRSEATPAITIHASFQAGTIFDPADCPGVANFVSRMLDRGTTSRTAAQIAEELDNRGVSLATTVNRHASSLVCTCLVEDLPDVLAVVTDVFARPTFPDSEVELRRGEIITTIRQDEDNPAAVAGEALLAALYGPSHPYGRRPRGSTADVERIDSDALQRFHADRFRPGTLSLALVGDVDETQAVAAAESVLRTWASTGAAASPVLAEGPTATARRVQVIPMMNKAQADIAYGFTSVRRDDAAFYACWLMNNILGQYSLGGRLGSSIRERQGMAYYVHSAIDANVIAGPLMIRAGVNPANVERAMASIDEELSAMAATGPSEQELRESKQYLIGSMPRNLETNSGIANFLQMTEFFGLGLDYDVRMPALLEQVTLADVHAAARRVLVPSRATAIVAGPYDGEVR